ncbi:T9SS type B sorting domain-containing protein [Poritiphilus flavus]|uniref:T9SS type B sorting domain-containing protein n=1 Tax=Poritiphilus flavus TaxID=2697053 RepID=A0A6L9E8W4_9FLAO|nr:T9SS type B sorting domain-containing protein [Poritiphilus flavus]NAS11008.1 T9SS type B sorting domain-containing protein [Poritiphilus flavus]
MRPNLTTINLRHCLLLFLVFVGFQALRGQEVPFSARLNDGGNNYINIKGDYTFLSNTVMNRRNNSRDANDNYNGTSSNNNLHIEYVDIDGDPTTFSSSSSTLTVPACSQIYWAGLYWAGNYDRDVVNSRYTSSLPNDSNRYDFTQIKFRMPGGSYIDIQADNSADPAGEEDEIIIDGFNTVNNDPYVCFRDVTTLLQGLADPNGEYFVANVRGTRGRTSYGVAGWTLVIIYENPTLPGRYISVFDGYEGVTTNSGDSVADIDVVGFNTIPVGPVQARIGVNVIEGEYSLSGDTFSIETPMNPGFTNLSNSGNPANNFFNANITIDGNNVTTRNINGTNSMGYDADIFDVNNPSNSLIANGDTQATLRLSTSSDWFASFLVTFGIDIIEPDILLEKRVEDIGGNDITGAGVNLGQVLDYVLSFQNTGNDDATNYTIRDVLPVNVTLDETNMTLPTGVTYTFDPATRTVLFNIPDNLVEEGDPFSSIRMRVEVAENCFDFIDACTDLIENLAYSTYEGVINDNQISDDPSVSDFDNCGFVTPGATNFLLDDLSACDFSRTVELCGANVVLDAGDNFDSYIWYIDENGDGLIDAGDTVITDGDPDNDPSTLLVTQPNTYIVDKIVADPCKGFQEIITVVAFGAGQPNPISELINDTTNTVDGQVLICPNDGEELPEIFLCGLNDTELIQVNIPDATSIVWEQLDQASCTASIPDCANRDASCTWNNVGTGNDFTASDAGEYRMSVNYLNGCFATYYFNIFKNPLNPQYTSSDIICTTPGNITVTNMPVDYEYQLLDATNGTILVPFSAANGPSFNITTNGAYRVEMRQQGVVDGCVFFLDNIGILDRDFQVDVTTRDTDCSGLGEISISVLNVEPQYTYEISQGGTTVDTHGPVSDNNYTFQNLNPGTYDILVTTDDGCNHTEQVTINDLSDLDLQATISQHISCREGNIQMNSTGGQTPHVYAIWQYVDEGGITQISYPDVASIPASEFQTSVIFDILDPGNYTFVVVDRNNCTDFSNEVTITLVPDVVYTTGSTDETCFGASDGTISYNVTDTNGYQVTFFLIDNTGTEIDSNSSGQFTGLPQGDYQVRLNQRKGSSSCDFFEDFTISGPLNAVSGTAAIVQDYTCLQNGIIEAQGAAGGTAPYEYSIDGVNFVSGAGAETFSGLTDGTYSITIRDANGCVFVTNSVTLDPLNEPSDLTFTSTTPNCPALTSDVTVTVVDGNTPFVFEIIAPSAIAATSITGNSADFDGLAPDTYTFRVTDNKGCTYDENFTIPPVSPIDVVGQLISNVTCFGGTDGEGLFTVSGFNTSYDYNITGPATFNGNAETNTTIPLPNLAAGTYSITVTDNNTNCTDTASFTVNGPAAALDLTATETQPTCTDSGSAILVATDGWGSYDYSLTYPDGITVVTNTTGNFNNLTQTGLYNALVTDANGCTDTATFTLNAAIAPVLSVTPNDVCYDSGVGLTLTATVTSGGDGNYQYRINGGAYDTNNVFTGLGPGTYTVDVVDGNNCTGTDTITINPELTVSASAPNITSCGTDTDISITAAGGDGNYVYAVVADAVVPVPGDFGAASTITVTGAGDYDVYVRDNNGVVTFCEAAFDITIAQDSPIVITPTVTDILCFGDATGQISLAIAGGAAPFEYSIDNGTNYQTTADFVNLTAGTYPVRVRDTNGCEQTASVVVNEPALLVAEAAITQTYTCLQLGEITVGSVTPTAGGSGDYQYSLNGGAWTAVTTGGTVFAGLIDGTYSIRVRDANAVTCFITLPDVIIPPLPVEPTLSTSVAYNCDGTGNVTVLPNDPSYTYSIDAGAPQASNVFNNVAVGPHTITVNYGSGCTVDTTVNVEPGNAFDASITNFTNLSCNAAADGTITFEVENFDAVNGFEYSVNGGGFSAPQTASPITVNGLSAGLVTIVVRDVLDNTCSITLNETLTEPAVLVAAASITDPFTCNNTGATITASATGGTPTYEYQLEDGVGGVITAYQAGTTFTALAAGDYIIRVRDTNGCEDPIDAVITVVAPNNPTFTTTATACYSGANDATIQVDVTSIPGNGGFQFSLNGGPWITPTPATATTHTFSNLAAGAYTIDVRDQFGCAAPQQNVTINPALSLSASAPNITSCGTDTDISITAAGGDGNYVYAVVADAVVPVPGDFGAASTITVTGAGDYDVYVRDNNGVVTFCEAAFDITIAQDAPIVITPTVTDILCFGDATGQISLAIAGGAAPFEYSIDNGTNYQTTADFVNLTAGTYPVRVRDTNGCEQTASVVVNEPALLVAEAAITQTYTCLQLGEITVGSVTPTAGGSGDYQYSLNGGAWTAVTTGGTVFAGLIDGTYSIRVRDANAVTCFITLPDVIIPPLPVEPTLSTSVAYNCDGTGNVTVLPNDPSYTYSIDAGAPQASNVFNNVAVGPHTITVNYGSGCTVDTTVNVEPGNAFDASITNFTNLSCNAAADGTITFEVENFDAVNGFEYSVNGGGFSAPQTASPITVNGLSAGLVTIVVRDVLDNTCSITLNETLTEPAVLVAAASITDPFTCNNTGATITASATGGTPTYEYQLEDGVGGVITAYQAGTTFTALAAGDYIVRVRDTNGCEDPIDAVITVVAPNNPTFTTTATACYSGANDATIQVDVTSIPGNGGFQFSLNGGPWITPTPATATTHTFSNLAAGAYTIDVRDQFGCVAPQQNVTINPQLTANSVLTTDLTCLASATITINANGGSGAYSYEWSDDAGVTYNSTSFAGNVFSTNTAGTYQFRVTDTTAPTACTVVTNAVIVTPADTPVITSVTPTHVLCNGDTTGSLDVVIDTSIGAPPYVINVLETGTPTNYGTQTAGLPAGNYEVTITDDKGCVSAPFAVTITEPNAISYSINLVPITCNPATGTDPGSIGVTGLTGGVAEYTYHLTGNNGYSASYTTTAGGEDYTFTILEFGIYEVDVVDANGCNLRTTNIIASPPNDLDIDVSTVTASCAAGGTAIVTVSSAVGSGNYEFAILETYAVPYSSSYQAPDVVGGDTSTFTGLIPGVTYTFVVHDLTTNCYYFETAATPINSPSNMTVTSLVEANVTCTGANDGNVTFTFDTFDAAATDVTYEIFNAQSNVTTGFTGTSGVNPPAGPITVSNFATLAPGVYYILLTEVGGAFNGCSISSPDFTIDESTNLLSVTATSTNDIDCADTGTISAVAQFGSGSYEFQLELDTAAAPTAATWTGTNTTGYFDGLANDDYTVYVKDSNDCIQDFDITVGLDARPDISLAIVDECVAEGTFEVLVTLDVAGLTPYQLSLNGGPFQNITFNGSNQYTVSGLSSGLGQTIAVRDLTGCPDTETFDIQPPLQFNATLSKLLDCSVSPNAEITIDVTAGSGNYDYEITGPVNVARTALPSDPFVWNLASAAGAYTVTIYDTSTAVPNCLGSIIVNVPAAVTPVPSIDSFTDVTCNGADDGTINVSALDNGIGPFTFQIISGPGSSAVFPILPTSNTNTTAGFTALEGLAAPGITYTIRATAANGCTTDITQAILQPDAIANVNASVVEFACATGNNPENATITIDDTAITGGSGTYVIYEFIDDQGTVPTADDVIVQSGPNNVYIETNVAGGTYIINVYDDNGCVGSTTAAIQSYDELLTATAAITNPISCNPGMDGEITITVTSTDNNTALFEYSIDNGANYQASNVFAGLDVGVHDFLIRHINTGCIITASETILDPNTFSIVADVVSDVECFGTQTGQVTFELTDATYVGPFDWTIYDTNGTPANTADDILVQNGTSPTNGPTAPIALFAGEYLVEVTQNNHPNCTNTALFNIAGPAADITANTEVTPITCVGNDGIIEIIDVLGGWGGYTYFVGTAAPTGPGDYVAGPEFTNLAPGTYEAWVRDSGGCERQVQNGIVLADPAAITATLQINQENCTNLEGELEVVGTTGGQGSNYTYQLIRNGVPFGAPQTTTVFSGLGEGSYEVQITDQWTCTATIGPEVLYDEINAVATVVKPIDCSVSPGGEITITQTGGSGTYSYTVTWPDLVTTSTNATGVFTGLTQVGTYSFTITDQAVGHMCVATITQDLDPAVLPVPAVDSFTNVTCNGADDGTINVSALDNGIGPFTFQIISGPGSSAAFPILPTSNTNTTASFTALEGLAAPGITYTIRATAANGCTTDITQVILQPDAIANVNASVVEFACATGNNPENATITIDDTAITGGSGTYVIYEFINDQGTLPTADDVIVQSGPNNVYTETNVAGGTYIINVYDDNGCVGSTTAAIQSYDELLTATAAITNPISCNPGMDGEITITVTSTDNNTALFEYSIDNGANYQASNVFAGLDVGVHDFLIRHINTGCIITASETILDPNTFSIVADVVSDVECFGTQTGQVTFELTDATYVGPFDWTIYDTNGTPANTADDILVQNGTSPTNGPTAPIALFAGEYLVEVTQNNHPNCTNTALFNIAGPAADITANTEVTPITCVGNDGIIEIIDVLGGWGGYTYFVGTAAPTGPGDYVAGPEFTNLAPGTYEAWVRDSGGCERQVQNGIVLADPAAITATLQINQENCTNLEGELEVVGTTGGQGSNYTYQLIRNGVPFGAPQTTTVFSGLGEGSYEVQITDQWTCTATIGPEVLYEEMQLTSTVVKPIDCLTTPEGEVTITVAGGSGNFDFTVTFPDLVTTASNATGVFAGLDQAGTYTFVVTDLNTTTPVCTKTITQDLDAATLPMLDVPTRIHVSCNGLADGEVTINLLPVAPGVNDQPVYTYTLYDATRTVVLQPTQTSPTFSGLAANTYEVQVLSGRSCEEWQTIVINEPAVLTASAVATAFACDASNTATTSTITVTAGGGTAPYLYSIDNVNFQASNTFDIVDNGAIQNITVYVTDANGCAQTDNVVLDPLNVFTAAVAQINAITCPNPELVEITVTDNGNPANTYTYELLPTGNPNGTFVGNPTPITARYEINAPGTYTFRVTDNATGCYVDTAPYTIAPYDLIEVIATATTQVTCFGGTDGELSLQVNNYTGTYDYQIFDSLGNPVGGVVSTDTSVNPRTITGLPGGNFYVNVVETDAASTFCDDDSNTVTIGSPDMPLNVTVTAVAEATCTDDQGEILVEITGGYAPYDIVLTNTTTTQSYPVNGVTSSQLFTGLSAGDYTVAVTDNGGCPDVQNLPNFLVPAIPITADITPLNTMLTCYGDTNGTVSAINVLNGSGSYQYQLNYYDATGTTITFTSGAQVSPIFDNLGAGIYSITVTDGWNCDDETDQAVITEPTEVMSSLIQLSAMTCNNNAQIELTATGGTGPYQWSTDQVTYSAFNLLNGPDTHVVTVTDGAYQFYVIDAAGCEAMISNEITIDPIIPLDITVDDSAATVNCTGEASASFIATATGGLGNYSYELYTDAGLTNLIAGPQPDGQFSNLIAGNYFVRVTSVDCETSYGPVVITEPAPLQIDRQEFTDVTCFGENDGTIVVEVSGGTGTIYYAISPNLDQFDTENVFTDLEPGVYDVIAQDENGCFIPFQFTLVEPTPLDVSYTTLPEICAGNNDGSVTVTITGGTAPYRTALNSNADADFVQDLFTYSDLAPGTYAMFIRDAQDCETNVIFEIEAGVNLNAVVEPVYECDGDTPDNYINITMEDPSVLGSIMYALDSTDPMDMQLNPDFRNIAPGSHFVAISHANGCIQTVDFEIEGFEPLTLTLEQNQINEITAVASGGRQEYTFIFDGENNGNQNTYFINRTDTFTVTVIDENGCEVSAQIDMEFIDIEIPTFFTPDGNGQNDYWIPENIEIFPEILMIIFDRYGREVYRMGYGDRGWDGIYNNTELPTGDYWYIIKLQGERDDREFVGHFTLYR